MPLCWISSVVRLCEWKEESHYDELSSQTNYSLTRLIVKASARYSNPLFPIRLPSTFNVLRVFEENERVLIVTTACVDISPYLIDLQGIGKVTTIFMTHLVARNRQFSQCLRTMIRWMKKEYNRPCLTWLTFKASARWRAPSWPIQLSEIVNSVSVCAQCSKMDGYERRGSCLTRLIFNASLILWTPSSRILLDPISSETSVCKQSHCKWTIRSKNIWSHFVDLQRISQILSTDSTDIVPVQVQFRQSLCEMNKSIRCETRTDCLTWLTLKTSLKYRAPSMRKKADWMFSVVNVYRECREDKNGRRRAIDSHSVDLQCLTQMPGSFVVD